VPGVEVDDFSCEIQGLLLPSADPRSRFFAHLAIDSNRIVTFIFAQI
jgi:hypothetical protein